MADRPALDRTITAVLDQARFGRYHVKVVLVLALVGFIEAYDTALTGTLVVSTREPLGLTDAQVQVLVVAPTITLVASMLVGAVFLADRLSRRTILLIGVTWSSLFTLLIPLATSAQALIWLRMLAGVGFGLALPSAYPIGAELMPPRHRATFAWAYEVCQGLGFTTTTVIGFLAAHLHSPGAWRLIPLTGGIFLFVAPPLVWRVVPESPRWLAERGRTREARAALARIRRKIATTGEPGDHPDDDAAREPRPVTPVTVLFGRRLLPRTLLAIGLWTCALVPFYIFSTLLPEILVHRGFVLAEGLGFAIAIFAVTLPGKVLHGYLMERIGRRTTIAGALFASTIGLVLLLTTGSDAGILAAEIVIGLTALSVFPTVRTYMAEQFPTEVRGRGYFTAEVTGRFVAGIPIPFLLAGQVARPGIIYTVAAAAVLLGGTLTAVFGRDTRGALEDVTPPRPAVEARDHGGGRPASSATRSRNA